MTTDLNRRQAKILMDASVEIHVQPEFAKQFEAVRFAGMEETTLVNGKSFRFPKSIRESKAIE